MNNSTAHQLIEHHGTKIANVAERWLDPTDPVYVLIDEGLDKIDEALDILEAREKAGESGE